MSDEGTAPELERLRKELREIAYVVSHDLRAPLRGLDHLCKWLTRDLGAQLTGEPAEYLVHMQERVQRLDRMLERMAEYSRVLRVSESPVPVDVARLVENVLAGVGADGTATVDVAAIGTLETPEKLLTCVLRELCDNAVRHGGGGLTVIGADGGDGMVELTVADRGPGVATEHQERIFQMFHTLTPQSAARGVGMGLCIARKAVEMAGGRLWVGPGPGLVMRFTWPRVWTARS